MEVFHRDDVSAMVKRKMTHRDAGMFEKALHKFVFVLRKKFLFAFQEKGVTKIFFYAFPKIELSLRDRPHLIRKRAQYTKQVQLYTHIR